VEGLAALLRWSLLNQLRTLDVGQNNFDDEGAELLAASRRLRNLERLCLMEAHLTDRGARALADSRNLPNLAVLDLFLNNDISEEGRALLRERFGGRVLFEHHEYARVAAEEEASAG
jgi:hypothetical protein